MSWKATAFVKELRRAPDGTDITRDQKLLMMILADYHNTERRSAWPSVPLLAKDALMSERHARDLIRELESLLVIVQIVSRSGRGAVPEYRFVGLDLTTDEARALLEKKKAAQRAPFPAVVSEARVGGTPVEIPGPISTKGAPKGAPKGAQQLDAIRNVTGLNGTEPKTPPPYPPQAGGATDSSSQSEPILLHPRVANESGLWPVVKAELKRQFYNVPIAFGRRPDFETDAYDRYFRDTWLERIENGVVYLGSPDPSQLSIGLQKFHRRLVDTFRHATAVEVRFEAAAPPEAR